MIAEKKFYHSAKLKTACVFVNLSSYYKKSVSIFNEFKYISSHNRKNIIDIGHERLSS